MILENWYLIFSHFCFYNFHQLSHDFSYRLLIFKSKQLIKSLHIKNAHIINNIPHNEVADYLKKSNIFWFSNLFLYKSVLCIFSWMLTLLFFLGQAALKGLNEVLLVDFYA